jgi:hypothetical protein
MVTEAREWLEWHGGVEAEIVLIAVDRRGLQEPETRRRPPAREPNDSRTPAYRRRYGDTVVEVEALAPEVLQDRLRKAISQRIKPRL